jgi:hypothetical protein
MMAPSISQVNQAMLEGLKVQVNSIERDYQELKGAVITLDHKIETGMSAIAAKLDERWKTPWGAIFAGMGVLITFLGMIGAMAYLPIQSELVSMKDRQQRETAVLHDRDIRMWTAINKQRSDLDQLLGREDSRKKPNVP